MLKTISFGTPGQQGEIRQRLTILFTDLSDSTRLSSTLEAEDYARLLDDIRLIFTEEVKRRGGVVNQFQGDGLQAIFGRPIPSEHDAVRAVEAALAVHGRVRALGRARGLDDKRGPHVHSGVHGGLTLARAGDSVAGRVELFGAVPGLAKHLSDTAAADEIWVSNETLGPALELFELARQQQLALKGREQALSVSCVVARNRLRRLYDVYVSRGLGPFVGREPEMQVLRHALQALLAGQRGAVAVEGAAGIGKTRLIEEFLVDPAAASCVVMRGVCSAELAAEPLQPFLQMLRSHLLPAQTLDHQAALSEMAQGLEQLQPELGANAPALLALLTAHGSGGQAAPLTPQTAFELIGRILIALASRAPLIVFIDDWQWVDRASRELALQLTVRDDLRMLGILGMRLGVQDMAAAGTVQTLRLGPLTDQEAQAVVKRRLPAADPFLVRRLTRKAGGNPLFIDELCHGALLAPATALAGSDTLAAISGSAWLEALIGSRVARLPTEELQVLSAAAVIGSSLPAHLLYALTGHGPDSPALLKLAEADLLYPGLGDGSLHFKHGVTRDTVYASIGLQQRRAWHARLAGLLSQDKHSGPAVIAYHLTGAGDLAGAAQHWEQAGDVSMASSALDRAKAQYRAALDALDALDRTAPDPQRYLTWRSIMRRLGVACVFDPSRDDVPLFQRAIERARRHEDTAGLAYAEYWAAYVAYALGDARCAVALSARAVETALKVGDPSLITQARGFCGQALAAAGETEAALPLLQQAAQALGQAPRRMRDLGQAYVLACLGGALGNQGRFDEAEAAFEQALAAVPSPGQEVEASVLCWRSAVRLWQGRWAEALADAEAAEAIARQVRSLYMYGMSLGLGGCAKWRLDPGPRAAQQMARAQSWLKRHNRALIISMIYGWQALAAAHEGRRGDLRASAACAFRRQRQGDSFGALMARRALALQAAADGDSARAERHLNQARKLAQQRQLPREQACNVHCAARVAHVLGQPSEAQALTAEAQAAFLSLGMHGHLRPLPQPQRPQPQPAARRVADSA